MKKILVTGGAGFVGAHTVLRLLENNFDIDFDYIINKIRKKQDDSDKLSNYNENYYNFSNFNGKLYKCVILL